MIEMTRVANLFGILGEDKIYTLQIYDCVLFDPSSKCLSK